MHTWNNYIYPSGATVTYEVVNTGTPIFKQKRSQTLEHSFQ